MGHVERKSVVQKIEKRGVIECECDQKKKAGRLVLAREWKRRSGCLRVVHVDRSKSSLKKHESEHTSEFCHSTIRADLSNLIPPPLVWRKAFRFSSQRGASIPLRKAVPRFPSRRSRRKWRGDTNGKKNRK